MHDRTDRNRRILLLGSTSALALAAAPGWSALVPTPGQRLAVPCEPAGDDTAEQRAGFDIVLEAT